MSPRLLYQAAGNQLSIIQRHKWIDFLPSRQTRCVLPRDQRERGDEKGVKKKGDRESEMSFHDAARLRNQK